MKPMADSFSNILMDLYPVEDTSHETAKFAAALEQMPLDTVKELAKAFGKKAAVGTIYPSKDEPATSSSEGRIHDFLKQDKVDPLFGKLKQAAAPASSKGESVGDRLKNLAKHVGVGAATIGAGTGLGSIAVNRILKSPEAKKSILRQFGSGAAIGAPLGAVVGLGEYAFRKGKKLSPEEKEQLKEKALAAQKKAATERLPWYERKWREPVRNYMYEREPELKKEVKRRWSRMGSGAGAGFGLGMAARALLGGLENPKKMLGAGLTGAVGGAIAGGLYHKLKRKGVEEAVVDRLKAEKAVREALEKQEKAKTSEAARILDLATDIAASSPAEMAGPIKKVAGRMLMECWKTAAPADAIRSAIGSPSSLERGAAAGARAGAQAGAFMRKHWLKGGLALGGLGAGYALGRRKKE